MHVCTSTAPVHRLLHPFRYPTASSEAPIRYLSRAMDSDVATEPKKVWGPSVEAVWPVDWDSYGVTHIEIALLALVQAVRRTSSTEALEWCPNITCKMSGCKGDMGARRPVAQSRAAARLSPLSHGARHAGTKGGPLLGDRQDHADDPRVWLNVQLLLHAVQSCCFIYLQPPWQSISINVWDEAIHRLSFEQTSSLVSVTTAQTVPLFFSCLSFR